MNCFPTPTAAMFAAFFPVIGCGSEPTDEPAPNTEIEAAPAAIQTGCPSDAPLCACALKGHAVCTDPDGDGLLSLHDNCDHVPNAGQANCDGDHLGDACDSNNVRVSRRTENASTNPIGTGRTTCVHDEHVHSMFFREIQWQTGTRTIETRQFCGPSGNRTETEVVGQDIDNHRCWQLESFGCDFTQGGPRPYPACGR